MSANSKAVVMDQYIGQATGVEALSGLSHTSVPNEAGASNLSGSVSLVVKPVMGLLIIRAGATAADSVSKALDARCGLSLSERLQSRVHDDYCIRWMSPDYWLLSCAVEQCYAIEKALRDAVSGHIALVNVSGGFTCLELTGKHAREVLMKSTGYDTHPDHLFSGKVVNTTFAKAQVTLRCISVSENNVDNRYELIVRRSFAEYVCLWIQRAAAEYGLVIVHEA